MINIFQIADNDQSIFYLGQIFGNVGIALSGTGPALLSVMFKTFNTAILVLGAIMVTYVTVVSVMSTAQEGEFMGKKFNSLWMPLRTVGGIAALMPTGSGYCAAQVIIMWIIVQGIGAADTVWKATLEYIDRGGALQTMGGVSVSSGQLANSGVQASNDVSKTVPTLVSDLFSSLVCQAAAVKFESNNADIAGHSMLIGNKYAFGRDTHVGECGTIGWDPTDPSGAQITAGLALKTIVPQLELLADQYVMMAVNDPDCWKVNDDSKCTKNADGSETCPIPPQPCTDTNTCRYFGRYYNENLGNASCILQDKDQGWNQLLTYAGSNFVTDVSKLVYGYAANYTSNATGVPATVAGTTISQLNDRTYQRAEADGWIFAGALYYYFAKQNNGVAQNYNDVLSVFTGKNPRYKMSIEGNFTQASDSFNKDNVMAFYCGTFPTASSCQKQLGAKGVAQAAIEGMNTAANIGGGGVTVASSSAGPMSAGGLGIISMWMNQLAPSSGQFTNPLIVLQNFGENCLIAAEALFWVGLGVVLLMGFGATNIIALGTTANYAQGFSEAMLMYFVPLYFSFIGVLISVGSLLGIYVPLIPYMLFTFGAIGWIIASIEAMVAAPIIALGIISPAGQHEILGRSEPAVMIILNIFLRPTLMVFGMMAGMLMSYVVIEFINAAFLNVVRSVIQGNTVGLIEGFLFIMAYAGLVITALNKCFSLIHLIPERVLRFIGGHPESYGEAEAAEQVKGRISEGAQMAGQAAGTLGTQTAKQIEQIRKDRGKVIDTRDEHGGGLKPQNNAAATATPASPAAPGSSPTATPPSGESASKPKEDKDQILSGPSSAPTQPSAPPKDESGGGDQGVVG